MAIRKLGDPVLRESSRKVEKGDPALKQLIKEMEEVLRASEGIGLAANQIGVLKRVIVYDVGEGLVVLLNPEIVWCSRKKLEEEEGCLSIPGVQVHIKRAARVKVKGMKPDGKDVVVEAEGLLARVLQHEIDHLNGILIIDRATEEERRRVLKELIGSGTR